MAVTRVPRPRARLAAAALLAAALLPLPAPGVAPVGAAEPASTPAPLVATPVVASPGGSIRGPFLVPPDARRPYRLNLATRKDWVQQATFVQCVGTSVQMMLNIVRPGRDRSARTQRELQALARSWSGPRPDGRDRRGAGVGGWAAALELRGAGTYTVVGADTLQGAMRVAAAAIREHHRPVGLLVWQGRHAWVMSGFEATRDPARGSFRVTKAYILDPLYPYGSRTWGPSPVPGAAIPVSAVGRQFVPRRSRGPWNRLPGMAGLAGKYVLVVPTGPIRAGLD